MHWDTPVAQTFAFPSLWTPGVPITVVRDSISRRLIRLCTFLYVEVQARPEVKAGTGQNRPFARKTNTPEFCAVFSANYTRETCNFYQKLRELKEHREHTHTYIHSHTHTSCLWQFWSYDELYTWYNSVLNYLFFYVVIVWITTNLWCFPTVTRFFSKF